MWTPAILIMENMLNIKICNERGQISLYFLLLIGLLLGALNYSLSIGGATTEKMESLVATDLASKSLADHGAAGFNLMSTNNLALGASLHISSAAQFVSRYKSILKTLAYEGVDENKLDKLNLIEDQNLVFEHAKDLSGHLLKTSKSITSFNKNMALNWMQVGVDKAFETHRLNKPDALLFVVQGNHPVGDSNLAYLNLNLSSVEMAYCHAIRSSHSMANRNRAGDWIDQPLASGGFASDWGEKVNELESETRKIVDKSRQKIKEKLDLLSNEYSEKCTNLKNNNGNQNNKAPEEGVLSDEIWCETYEYWQAETVSAPFPAFENCGLNHGGNFGEMSTYFAVNNEDFVVQGGHLKIRICHEGQTVIPANEGVLNGHMNEHPGDYMGKCQPEGGDPDSFEIGFIYPEINSKQDFDNFQKSNRFGMMALSPFLNEEELKKSCPTGLRDRQTGVCLYNPGGQNILFSPHKEKNIWKRTSWNYSQFQSTYRPSLNDPTTALIKDANVDWPKAKMQLFWPAWTSRQDEPSLIPTIINELKAL